MLKFHIKIWGFEYNCWVSDVETMDTKRPEEAGKEKCQAKEELHSPSQISDKQGIDSHHSECQRSDGWT